MNKHKKNTINKNISHLKIRRVQYAIFSIILIITTLTSLYSKELTWQHYFLFIITGFTLGLFANTWFKIKDIEENQKSK